MVHLHDPPLGFDYDSGGLFVTSAFDVLPYGLNNQLMILAKLIESSCTLIDSLPKGLQTIILRLPLFSGGINVSSATISLEKPEAASYIEFGHLFDLEYFNRGMKDICGINQPLKFLDYNYQESSSPLSSTECDKQIYDGYQHATVMVSKMRTRGLITVQLYNSLSPSTRIQTVLDECRSLLHVKFRDGDDTNNNPENNSSVTPSLPKFVAVHMRVERDWVDGYCQAREIEQGYRACFNAEEIAKLVSSYLRNNNTATSEIAIAGNTSSKVYIIAAVDRLRDFHPKPENVWPTNYDVVSNKLFATSLASYTSLETYIERAALDMFIAFDSKIFIGMTQSTMSNAITMRRFLNGKTSYAYDCDIEGGYSSIRLRTDRGEYDGTPLACLS